MTNTIPEFGIHVMKNFANLGGCYLPRPMTFSSFCIILQIIPHSITQRYMTSIPKSFLLRVTLN